MLSRVERRSFPSGSIVLAEGDSPHEAYVVESGAADVFVSDSAGEQHRIGYVTPGGTLGEMSMLTGEPAAGTVRATTDLEVYAIDELEFDRLASRVSGHLPESRRDPLRAARPVEPPGAPRPDGSRHDPPRLGRAAAARIRARRERRLAPAGARAPARPRRGARRGSSRSLPAPRGGHTCGHRAASARSGVPRAVRRGPTCR